MTEPTQTAWKPCAYCDRTFSKVEHLKRHQRLHTGEKPFRCKGCGRRYARSDVLARHFRNQHPELDNGRSPPSVGENTPNERNKNESIRRSSTRQDDDTNLLLPVTGTPPAPPHSPVQNAADIMTEERSSTATAREATSSDQVHETLSEQNVEYSQMLLTNPSFSSVHQDNRRFLDAWSPSAMNIAPTTPFPDDQQRPGKNSGDTSADLLPPHELIPGTTLEFRHLAPLKSTSRRALAPEQPKTRLQWRHTFSQGTADRTMGTNNVPKLITAQQLETQDAHHHRSVSHGDTVLESSRRPSHIVIPMSPYAEDDENSTPLADIAGLEPFDMSGIDFLRPSADLDLSWMNTSDVDLLDLDSAMISLPTPCDENGQSQSGRSESLISPDRFRRIQLAWPRKRISPVRLIRSLWRSAAQHGEENVLSQRNEYDAYPSPLHTQQSNYRWNLDSECRERLMRDYDLSHLPTSGRSAHDVEQDAVLNEVASEVMLERTASSAMEFKFPSRSMLEISLDFYFRRFHPSMPFVHQATFDAKKTPSSVLFPMCLIGLSILDPRSSKGFIHQQWTRMVHRCRIELTSQALGNRPPLELLTALTSALLVLNLALCISTRLDENQVHMLCIQALHIAEKHGLFAACDGEELNLELLGEGTDPPNIWKTWARVESAKRIILSLLIMDATYTRLLGTAGVIEADKLEVILPCESALFEAPTASSFLHAVNADAPIIMPRMSLRQASTQPPSALKDLGIQAFLAAVSLHVSVARHRLLAGRNGLLETHSFIPAKIFATDPSAKTIAPLLASTFATYSDQLGESNLLATLSWHNLCVFVTADLDQFELASGRRGVESAQSALANITIWSQTAAARRAALHAAQTFRIISNSRVTEPNMLAHENILFTSALVLGLYVYTAPEVDDHLASPESAFEVLGEIDWADVGGEGLLNEPDAFNTADCSAPTGSEPPNCCGARKFIRDGGVISYAGEIQLGGDSVARKILLNYAHLLDEVRKWEDSEYSQVLRIISDLFDRE